MAYMNTEESRCGIKRISFVYMLPVKNPPREGVEGRDRFRAMQYVLTRNILLAFYCYAPYPFMSRTIPGLSKEFRRERFAVIFEAWLYFYVPQGGSKQDKKEDFQIVGRG